MDFTMGPNNEYQPLQNQSQVVPPYQQLRFTTAPAQTFNYPNFYTIYQLQTSTNQTFTNYNNATWQFSDTTTSATPLLRATLLHEYPSVFSELSEAKQETLNAKQKVLKLLLEKKTILEKKVKVLENMSIKKDRQFFFSKIHCSLELGRIKFKEREATKLERQLEELQEQFDFQSKENEFLNQSGEKNKIQKLRIARIRSIYPNGLDWFGERMRHYLKPLTKAEEEKILAQIEAEEKSAEVSASSSIKTCPSSSSSSSKAEEEKILAQIEAEEKSASTKKEAAEVSASSSVKAYPSSSSSSSSVRLEAMGKDNQKHGICPKSRGSDQSDEKKKIEKCRIARIRSIYPNGADPFVERMRHYSKPLMKAEEEKILAQIEAEEKSAEVSASSSVKTYPSSSSSSSPVRLEAIRKDNQKHGICPKSRGRNQMCLCGGKFSHRGNLITHILQRTKGGGEFPCSVCGKRFDGTGRLRTHVKRVHKHNLRFSVGCRLCGLACGSYSQLFVHRTYEHGTTKSASKAKVSKSSGGKPATKPKHSFKE